MNATETIAENVRRALPNVKRGTLRFWGAWFGKPYDRLHTLLRCEAKEDVLRLYFDQGEVVSVWLPRGFSMDESTFLIATAERVRLEWFYDGLPEIDGNLFFEDFDKTGYLVEHFAAHIALTGLCQDHCRQKAGRDLLQPTRMP